MAQWDEIDPKLAAAAKRVREFDEGPWRECPRCHHRHRRGEICGYALNAANGCGCRQ